MKRKDTNPKDGAATDRIDLSLIPAPALVAEALAMSEGHLKYRGYNWRVAGARASVYVAAALRHILKYYEGEWADPETHVPHLGSARACLGILLDCDVLGNLVDDRPPAQNTAQYMEQAREIVAHLQRLYPDAQERYTDVSKPT